MLKAFPKILTIIFVSLIIIQTGAFLFINLSSQSSQAANIEFTPQVEIPGFPSYTFTKDSSTKPIGEYIKAIYKYAIGIVGILAAVVLMIGGVIWLTAGGSAERIGKAKEYIGGALTGLILALCSFMILATINPALVEFRITEIKTVDKTITGCCPKLKTTGQCSAYSKEDECKSGWKKGSGYICEDNKCVEADTGCCLYDKGFTVSAAWGYRSCKTPLTLNSCEKLPDYNWNLNLKCNQTLWNGLWTCIK